MATRNEKFRTRVQKYLTKWQGFLRLNDWRIKLIIVEKNYADRPGNSGTIYGSTLVNTNLRAATIKIAETTGDREADDELEATVIHELLHLHFDPYPWGQNETRDVMMEQTVDTLSICLMKLHDPRWWDPRVTK